MSEREKLHGIVPAHEPAEECLNARQRIAYREHRRDFIDWSETRGKEPDAYEGYAYDIYYVYANVVCQFPPPRLGRARLHPRDGARRREKLHGGAADRSGGLLVAAPPGGLRAPGRGALSRGRRGRTHYHTPRI